MSYPVGIVGVGNMGGGMAGNLLAQAWPVWVRDTLAQREQELAALGARTAASPADMAHQVDLVIVCVVDAQQTDDVLFGPSGLTSAGKSRCRTVMLCPTISPESVESVAARLAQHGLAVIDAPMSGGPVRARDGSMSLMVACPDAVFDAHRELVEVLSNKLFRISERPGDGARTKLVNNLLAGINLVGAAEVLALAQRMGLDTSRTLDVMEQSSGQSWIGSDRMRRALRDDYAPRAHMTLLTKDTALAVQAAQAVGFQGPLGASASAVFAQAVQAGLAHEDDAALFKLLSGQVPTIAE